MAEQSRVIWRWTKDKGISCVNDFNPLTETQAFSWLGAELKGFSGKAYLNGESHEELRTHWPLRNLGRGGGVGRG